MEFRDLICTEEQLRSIVPPPAARAVDKALARLDAHCRAIISRSSLVLIASCDAAGRLDVSPKGDPSGFVQILDEWTLAIPDRPGNRRVDTFRNVLSNARVGLLFLVPGRQETLRVNGRALLVRDAVLRQRLTVRGKVPELALVVAVEEAFVHCGKCMIRAQMWNPQSWAEVSDLPSHARCLLDQARLTQTIEEIEASVERNYRDGVY